MWNNLVLQEKEPVPLKQAYLTNMCQEQQKTMKYHASKMGKKWRSLSDILIWVYTLLISAPIVYIKL